MAAITTKTVIKDVKEVKMVRSDAEANDLLSKGWMLMNAGVSHTDSAGYQAKHHYILARRK